MQIKPPVWTHHHAHRLYHMSLGFCFAFAALAMIGTMTTVWMNAGAEDVEVTATVVGVTPGPGNSGGVRIPPKPNPNPTITIVAEPVGQIPTQGLNYLFSTARPAFSGSSSVPNGLVFITVRGQTELNSTAQANLQGNWYWKSPVDLPIGSYTIRAAVFDSFDLTRSGSAQASFIIQLPEPPSTTPPTPGQGNPPGSPITPAPGVPVPGTPPSPGEPTLPPVVVPSNLLFGIFFNVLDDYKNVTVGNKVVASVTLVSNSGKQIDNQDVYYRVISPSKTIIVDTVDTVSFSRKAQLLKTFFTALRTQPGEYTIEVSSTFEGVKSVATDTFRLVEPTSGGTTEPVAPAGRGPIVMWLLMILLLLLFIVLAIIAYRWMRHHTKEINAAPPDSVPAAA